MKMYFIKFHGCFNDTSVTTYENFKGGGHGKYDANFIGQIFSLDGVEA